jgi:hypothetical protein
MVFGSFAQQDHTLLLISSTQQDPSAKRDFQWRLTIPQQLLQEGFVFPLQHESVGFATAHGTSLSLASERWPTLAHATDSRNLFIAEFRHQVTRHLHSVNL